MVVDYRTRVLKISEEDELDTKLTRIPSAKKYKGKRPGLCWVLPFSQGWSLELLALWGCSVPCLVLPMCPPCPCPFLSPDIIRQPSEEEIIKLAPPPKKA